MIGKFCVHCNDNQGHDHVLCRIFLHRRYDHKLRAALHVSLHAIFTIISSAALALLVPSTAAAWDQIRAGGSTMGAADKIVSISAQKISPTPERATTCHLSVQQLPTSSGLRSQRTAGARDMAAPAAMLGLLLGVQTALGPKEVTRQSGNIAANVDAALAGNGTNGNALAIARYRECQKAQALQKMMVSGQ